MLLKQDFFKLEPGEKGVVVNKLIAYSAPSYNFFLMFLLAIIITVLGLLISSPTVIIGGMLIAPILYPILSLSMGVVTANFKLMKRSCTMLLAIIIFSIVSAFIISLFVTRNNINSEILARTSPSMIYFFIAFISGIAAAYALSKPKLSEVLPGVAIAVSVLPPLVVCGIALAFFEWHLVIGAFSLFFLNIVGIIFASIIVFSLLGFYERRRQIDRKIEIEEKIEEKKQAEKTKEGIKDGIEEATKKIEEVKKLLNGKEKKTEE